MNPTDELELQRDINEAQRKVIALRDEQIARLELQLKSAREALPAKTIRELHRFANVVNAPKATELMKQLAASALVALVLRDLPLPRPVAVSSPEVVVEKESSAC
jgi:uncharacterized surface protein with fasciclin (FAS1) repeats